MRQKILVIDDEPDIRGLLTHLLSREYTVIEAADGAEGLRLFKRHDPHLVLLDINLPDLRGTDVLRAIRKHDKHSVVLMLSSYGDLKSMRETLALGAAGHISKPFDCARLRAAVRAALQSSAA
jgi:two-component system KDP operon response regulator KdpE